jgi:hypothetical protein
MRAVGVDDYAALMPVIVNVASDVRSPVNHRYGSAVVLGKPCDRRAGEARTNDQYVTIHPFNSTRPIRMSCGTNFLS